MSNPTKAELAEIFNATAAKAEKEGRVDSKVTEGLTAVIEAMPNPDIEVVARILQDINAGREVLRPTQDWSKTDIEEQGYYLSRANIMVEVIQAAARVEMPKPPLGEEPPDLDIQPQG